MLRMDAGGEALGVRKRSGEKGEGEGGAEMHGSSFGFRWHFATLTAMTPRRRWVYEWMG